MLVGQSVAVLLPATDCLHCFKRQKNLHFFQVKRQLEILNHIFYFEYIILNYREKENLKNHHLLWCVSISARATVIFEIKWMTWWSLTMSYFMMHQPSVVFRDALGNCRWLHYCYQLPNRSNLDQLCKNKTLSTKTIVKSHVRCIICCTMATCYCDLRIKELTLLSYKTLIKILKPFFTSMSLTLLDVLY